MKLNDTARSLLVLFKNKGNVEAGEILVHANNLVDVRVHDWGHFMNAIVEGDFFSAWKLADVDNRKILREALLDLVGNWPIPGTRYGGLDEDECVARNTDKILNKII